MSISTRASHDSNPFKVRTGGSSVLLAVLPWLLLVATTELKARDFQVAVLPFRIQGNVPTRYFSPETLPTDLQKAAGFLFEIHKQYPLDPIHSLNRRIPGETLSQGYLPGTDYCNYTRGTYLLKGQAYFRGDSGLTIEMKLQSCNTGQVLHTASRSGSLSDLQSVLVAALRGSSPNLRSNELPPWKSGAEQWILVVDQSGSMAAEKEALGRALRTLQIGEASASLSVGLILVGEKGIRSVPPGSTDQALSILQGSGTGGEVDLNRMATGLQELNKWSAQERTVLVFTDAPAHSTAQFESAIRNLTSRGSRILLLQTANLPASSRKLYERLNRSLKLQSPDVVYGKRAGFAEGFSLFFLRRGNRFYMARKDVSSEIQSGNLPADLEAVATVNLNDDRLTLDSVIRAYAKQNTLRLMGTGPLISSLEQELSRISSSGPTGGKRVLLRNQGTAFWIRCNPSTARMLQSRKNQGPVYVGLQLRSGPVGLENHPDRVYIRENKEVPALFVHTYQGLSTRKSLKGQDIWFFLVEVVDIR